MDGTLTPHAVAGYFNLLDQVLREESVERALAQGARALAKLTGAEVAAVLLIEGNECVLEAWHPDEPAVRERCRPSFFSAAAA